MSGKMGSDPVEGPDRQHAGLPRVAWHRSARSRRSLLPMAARRRQHGLWPYSKATEQAPLAVCAAETIAASVSPASTSPPRIISACRPIRRSRRPPRRSSTNTGFTAPAHRRLPATPNIRCDSSGHFRFPRSRKHRALSYRMGRRLRRDQGAGAAERSRRDGRPVACLPARRRALGHRQCAPARPSRYRNRLADISRGCAPRMRRTAFWW